MTSYTTERPKLDLRAADSRGLRQDTYGAWRRVTTLVLGDICCLSLAWVIAGIYGIPLNSFWKIETNPLSLFVVLPIEIGLIASQGLYQSGQKRYDYWALTKTVTFAHIFLLLIGFLSHPNGFISRSTYLLSWLLSILLVCAERLCIDLLLKQLRKTGKIRTNTLLICPPEDTEKAASFLEKENCYKTIHTLEPARINKSTIKIIIESIRFNGIPEVFVSSSSRINDRMFFYWSLRNAGIALRILPVDLEPFYQNSEILMLSGVPTIKLSPPIIIGVDFLLKRCFDFAVSAALIILLAPILITIAIAIKLDSPGPILYKQERGGLQTGTFKAWKFRTMVVNADQLIKELEARNEMKDGVLFKMKDDPRITRVGKFLRRSSLDELPQLFNVLFGEMSLVGPRPLPLRDVYKYTPSNDDYHVRHAVLPGITGLWQVSGRSDITSFEEVVRLDTFYMENWSLWLDFKILVRTALVLLQRKGAY